MTPHRRVSRAAAFAAAVVATLSAVPDASAVPVLPGIGEAALPGTSAAADPSLAGTVIADVTSHWVSADDPLYDFPGAEGDLQSRVVREDGTGTLDFYWRLTVYGPSYPGYVPTSLRLVVPLDSFLTGAAFDADYRLDQGADSAPTTAFATAGSIRWSFDAATFGPGSSSDFLLLRSNVTTYYSGALAEVGVSSLATFSPTLTPPPVPEPAGSLLVLAGLATLAGLRRHRSTPR